MKTIIGLFDSYERAEETFDALERLGFSGDEVSIIAQEKVIPHQARMVNETIDATAEGAAGGAMLGGLTGLLIGIGALTIPGIGPVLAAGPLAAALATAAVGAGIGAATGGIVGALIDLGFSETEAQMYAESVQSGRILLTVKANEKNVPEVSEVMSAHGATDVTVRERARTRVR